MKESEKSEKLDVPILKDVITPGKKQSSREEVSGWSEVQLNVLNKQIEEIIQKRLHAVVNKAAEQAVRDIKNYLDKVLPELIKTVQKNNRVKK